MANSFPNRRIVDEALQVIRLAPDACPSTFALPADGGIFPLPLWLARKQEIISRYKRIGLWLDSLDALTAVADDLHYFEVIALDIPQTGHAAARLLRERYRFRGELRMLGDRRNASPVPLIELNGSLRETVALKKDEAEAALAAIARTARPAVFASGDAARDQVLADIVAASGLPVSVHAADGRTHRDLLAGWSEREIWAYIHLHGVPYGASPAGRPHMSGRAAPPLRLVQSCMARQ